MFKKLAIIALGSISAFAMHTAEININDKDLEFAVNIDVAQHNHTVEPDTTFIGVKYLKGTKENSEDENGKQVNINELYETSFLMKRDVPSSDIKLGIGMKLNYTRVGGESYMSAPLGIEADYKFATHIPITVGAKLYYAPSSLSFAKANNFLEYRFEGAINIIDRGSIIVGYRSLDTNFKINAREYDISYNKSGYIGFRFAF